MKKNKLMSMNERNMKYIGKTFVFFLFAFTALQLFDLSVWAASTSQVSFDVIMAPFNIFKNLMSAIISAIGYIITLWGIGEWGLSYQGSEGTMQAQSIKRIGGGMVMVLAPQILAVLI